MATAFGVTPTGFVPKPLATTLAEIQADLQATFGAGINLSPQSVFGQLANRLSQREADIWNLGQAIYSAFDPTTASDEALDNLCALTGTTRLPATKSTLTIGTNPEVLVGTNATPVPSGTVVSVTGTSPSVKFTTTASATIATLAAWAATTTYLFGDLKTNGGNIYFATQGGVSAGAGGPAGTGTAIVDGGVIWRYIAAGSAAVAVSCSAQDFGVKAGPAGTITVIETPVGGLSSVVNPLDATLGRDIETNAALKIRREAALRAQGNAALEALRADVQAVTGVTNCNILQNDTDLTDGNGLPPHSIECIVLGGTDAAVRSAILGSKAAGTRAYGANAGTIADSQGSLQQIDFTRPTTLNIWIIVNGTKDPATYPSTGDADIKQALVNYSLGLLLDSAGKQIFAGYKPGDTVNAWNLTVPVKTISGVKTITSILIGLSSPPTLSNDLPTTIRQLAQLDTSRITVALT